MINVLYYTARGGSKHYKYTRCISYVYIYIGTTRVSTVLNVQRKNIMVEERGVTKYTGYS